MDPRIKEKLAEMRRLERQAKQLIYKMERIESDWNQLKKELEDEGKEIPHLLGDIVHRYARARELKNR